MSNYQELLQQALTVHGTAQQRVRGPQSSKRIADAVEGFAKPFEALATVVANAKSGKSSDPDDTALLEALRAIESQRALLQAVVERAEADDDATVRGVVVDQPSARALAGKQKEADQKFLDTVNEVLDIVREDLGHPNAGN
jgi:hypothetical protein